MKKIFVVTFLFAFSVSSTAIADTLWDSGPIDTASGFSNAVDGVLGEGISRFLLADFVVDGAGWSVTDFHWQHVWVTPGIGQVGTGMELSFIADNGGTPTGDVVGIANNVNYSSVFTGQEVFSREVIESSVDFDSIVFEPGVYWFRAAIVGPENNFWLSADLNGSEGWADYSDMGGLRPFSDIFGIPEDLHFRIGGSIIPEPTSFGFLALGSIACFHHRRKIR